MLLRPEAVPVPTVTEADELAELLARGDDLRNVVAQRIDVSAPVFDLEAVEVAGAVFLGCDFASAEVEGSLVRRGALVIGGFEGLPYEPFRTGLYTPAELNEDAGGHTRDAAIYAHYKQAGRSSPNILEALAQRLHDTSIDDALGDAIGETVERRLESRLVAIMGGHSVKRNDWAFFATAHTARLIASAGYQVVTGGGPGAMEAGNLGAYFADHEETDLNWALTTLAPAPDYTVEGWRRTAEQVVQRFPEGRRSYAVPTWFYGHEPSNLFSQAIAKYFSNSLREDGLLALALHGIVFSPGSAGTLQEIFQDNAQNRYETFDYRSPMVFLGRYRWGLAGGVYDLVRAEGAAYADMMTLVDYPQAVVDFLVKTPPREKQAAA